VHENAAKRIFSKDTHPLDAFGGSVPLLCLLLLLQLAVAGDAAVYAAL